MKRYDLDSFDQFVEREDGSMVFWEDVQSLQAERDRLRAEMVKIREFAFDGGPEDDLTVIYNIARKAIGQTYE